MAKGYNLLPNEALIMKQERVSHGGLLSGYTDELILTNLNLVLVSKGVFGNSKGIQTFPINQIKVFNDQAQALLGKQANGSPQLDVNFINGQESFGFESKRDVIKWVNSINKLVTGNEAEIDTTPTMAIPGAAVVADTLKGTLDTFKGAFGVKSKGRNGSLEKVATKCSSCGAPISGTQGQVVTCQYCNSDQQL